MSFEQKHAGVPLTRPALDRWRQCMDAIDEPCGMSAVANDTLVCCIRNAIANAMAQQREACARDLLSAADRYERNGQPGPLGYNLPGWREVARILRKTAEAIRKRTM